MSREPIKYSKALLRPKSLCLTSDAALSQKKKKKLP